jgi:outer membrane protein TolC
LSVLLALLCVLVTSNAARADASMDRYVAEVVTRSPALRARHLAHEAARREASAAGIWPDPTLTVMLDNVPGHEGGEMPMVRYQVSQMVPWPGKLGSMEDAAERQADVAAAQADVRRAEIVLEAKRAYLMLGLNRRAREVNGAAIELVSTIARASLARYGAGGGGHHEVARAEVERAALEVERLDLEGERQSVLAMLNALRNRPARAPVTEPDRIPITALPPATLERLTDVAMRARAELRAMRAMQRESESMADLSRRERFPDLMAGVWYNQMIGEPDSVGVMAGVTLPIFNVERQSRRASGFDARAASAGQEIAAMQAMIRFEVADALRRVETATRQLELLRGLALPRVRDSFGASLAAYAGGSAEIVGLLDARRSLQSMEIALARAETGREMAIAQLERALGGKLPGAK